MQNKIQKNKASYLDMDSYLGVNFEVQKHISGLKNNFYVALCV